MKKLFLILVAAAIVLAPASIWSQAASGVPAGQKIATVDLAKVFEKYYKTIRSSSAIKQEAADMEKERADMIDAGKKTEVEWHKLIEKSEDQAISAEERAKSKKAAEDKFREIKSAEQNIQEYDRTSTARLREKNRQRRDDIVKEIRNVLDADAKAGGYNLVIDISGESANMTPVILYSSGVADLTENLIKELNAAAPPGSLDEKDTKDSKGAK
jgi:Skp family chaperone for outer membrane proteins